MAHKSLGRVRQVNDWTEFCIRPKTARLVQPNPDARTGATLACGPSIHLAVADGGVDAALAQPIEEGASMFFANGRECGVGASRAGAKAMRDRLGSSFRERLGHCPGQMSPPHVPAGESLSLLATRGVRPVMPGRDLQLQSRQRSAPRVYEPICPLAAQGRRDASVAPKWACAASVSSGGACQKVGHHTSQHYD